MLVNAANPATSRQQTNNNRRGSRNGAVGRIGQWSLLLAATTLLAACAGTPRGSADSAVSQGPATAPTATLAAASTANTLHSRAFGDPANPAVVFLHGGPGYNAFLFERTAAGSLAAKGFYVVVYDQRGGGRSPASSADRYNFDEAVADLEAIYAQYGLRRATLLGHSFGGTLGLQFAARHPDKVERLILSGSPLSYPAVLATIQTKARAHYTRTNSPQLAYIDQLEKMDPASCAYAGYSFMHAIGIGLYRPATLLPQAQSRYAALMAHADARLMSDSRPEPFLGFCQNEKYTTLDVGDLLARVAQKVRVTGIYGAEDGLFDEAHFTRLRAALGADNFVTVANASHNVFADNLDGFIEQLMTITARK